MTVDDDPGAVRAPADLALRVAINDDLAAFHVRQVAGQFDFSDAETAIVSRIGEWSVELDEDGTVCAIHCTGLDDGPAQGANTSGAGAGGPTRSR